MGTRLSPAAAIFDTDGTDIVAERSPAGAVTQRYVFGPGRDEPLVWYQGSGTSTRRWFHADERGSIVAFSDGAAAAERITSYDEYGTASAAQTRFTYAGKIYFGGISAYYNEARFYDPRLGRFLQTDPIGYGDGMNLYAYVGGDPVNLIDPSGLDGEGTPSEWEPPREGPLIVIANVGAAQRSSGAWGTSAVRGVAEESRLDFLTGDWDCAPGGTCVFAPTIVVRANRPPFFVRFPSPLPPFRPQPPTPDLCGSGWSSRLIPDRIPGASLQQPCGNHDDCYATLGSSKFLCDLNLGAEVGLACMSGRYGSTFCVGLGGTYFWGVTIGGVGPYNDAQEGARRTRP